METRLIFSIITLLLLAFSESNAGISNDTLFTSPNENTKLVQQLIDSLVSIDTDYIVHVKKIDNSTSQTLYSNYILWADVIVKDTNRYGIKELDDIYISRSMISSVLDTGSSITIDLLSDLFYTLNSFQKTLFVEIPLLTSEFKGDSDCILEVVIRNEEKIINFVIPCNPDYYSEYYYEFSKSIFYPIFLLIDRNIKSYINIYDYALSEEDTKIIQLNRELTRYLNYKKRIVKFINGIMYDSNKLSSEEYSVYVPLVDNEISDSLFIDSLCRSGVNNMIIDYKNLFWDRERDTTTNPTSSFTEIIWRDGNSDYLKLKYFGKYLISPTYLIQNELFIFLSENQYLLKDTIFLNKITDGVKNFNLWDKEQKMIVLEKEEKRNDLINYPLLKKDTIMVYGDILKESIGDNNCASESYKIFFDNIEMNFYTASSHEPSNDYCFKYIFKEYCDRGFYTLELLIEKFQKQFENEIGLSFKDCITEKLNNVTAKKFWLKQLERLEKDLKEIDKYITELENELKELESENNSK